jgi:MoaA/NifB/PqqE/SkfB family radical SAM enzyme
MDYFEKLKDYTSKQAINLILKGLTNSSDENLIRLTHVAEKISPRFKPEIGRVRKLFKDKAPAYILAKKALKEIHPNVREKMVLNFMIKYILLGAKTRENFEKKEGIPSPATIVISPTMRCNLRCTGCYAGDYSKKDDLPIEYVDKVITEAKEMGTCFFVISGGEAFVRDDMLDVYKKHNDVAFMIYTNGTFIDRDMAFKLQELGNVAPAISVEGFEKETDARRGKGVWKKVMQAMDNCRETKLIYGFSITPTKYNSDVVYSDELMKILVEDKGCMFGWYFTYIPIGRNPDVSLMQTPEQRLYGWRRVNYLRNKYPVFIGDFWNDGMHVNGCIAGGRQYLHVNVKGDYEPCVFTHCATHNVRNASLKEALASPLFRKIREEQKRPIFVNNRMRPCMIIDHPEILREVVKETGAKPTHGNAQTVLTKCATHLDQYAKEYGELSKPFWEKVYVKKEGMPPVPQKLEDVKELIKVIKS